ncbi:MAG: hypothetical protein ABI347_03265 [Nitrososphaera sp.]|jgi:hypothetical protein
MTQVDLYCEELKTQSIRDLELAKRLVGLRVNAEHIAWLCEQSYEKILKHVFASYLASRGVRVEVIDGKLRRAALAGQQWRISTLDIARDVSRAFFDILLRRDRMREKNERQSPSARTLLAQPTDLWQNLETSMEKVIDQTSNTIESSLLLSLTIQNCTKENFLNSASSWALAAPYFQPSPSTESKEKDPLSFLESFLRNNMEGIRANFSIQGFDEATKLMTRLTKTYYAFVLRAIMMAYWLLPLSETSRYPMPEYHSENLKKFREFESQLIDFYAVVAIELERLIESSAYFNEAMADLRKFMEKA